MTHSIQLFFLLSHTSQTNILFCLCQSLSSFETILRHCIWKSEGAAEGIWRTAHSLLLALISVHIRRDALSIWYVISGRAVPSRTLYPSLPRDEAVYYYGTEVISDAMCPHAKNNAQNMPWIPHGHCSTPDTYSLPAFGKWAHSDSPRFQASTSIIAVNVRTCLCLCNSLVYTPMPLVVCINCGWIELKGQFIKTGEGCQDQTREWKE